MQAVLVTTNRNTFDVILIISAVLFFVAALLHLWRQPNPIPGVAIGLCVGMLGATALAIALLFF